MIVFTVLNIIIVDLRYCRVETLNRDILPTLGINSATLNPPPFPPLPPSTRSFGVCDVCEKSGSHIEHLLKAGRDEVKLQYSRAVLISKAEKMGEEGGGRGVETAEIR